MQEGIAVGRSFAMLKNYNIDGNKEMIAIGTMNILGSFTSCYLTTGTIPILILRILMLAASVVVRWNTACM
jgi:MFS superfamily sulfate permease-like transporter